MPLIQNIPTSLDRFMYILFAGKAQTPEQMKELAGAVQACAKAKATVYAMTYAMPFFRQSDVSRVDMEVRRDYEIIGSAPSQLIVLN